MAEMKFDITKVVDGAIKEFKHQGYHVSKWISVDDALPEKDGYYLVVTQGIHNSIIDIAEFWHYAEWVQKEIRENYWNKYDKVLYWQPLPELPEAI